VYTIRTAQSPYNHIHTMTVPRAVSRYRPSSRDRTPKVTANMKHSFRWSAAAAAASNGELANSGFMHHSISGQIGFACAWLYGQTLCYETANY
jgi:hypothetical protein